MRAESLYSAAQFTTAHAWQINLMDELYYSRLLTITRSTLGYLLIRDYSMGFIRRRLLMPNVYY